MDAVTHYTRYINANILLEMLRKRQISLTFDKYKQLKKIAHGCFGKGLL